MILFYRLPAIFLLTTILASTLARSQALYEVSSDEKISNSGLIVEGKVIGKKSYWNPRHTMIFTANEVEVYKVFKGSLQEKTIEVVTSGGFVDNYAIIASDLLQLDNNDIGIFYCQKSAGKPVISKENAYDVFSSSQGFIKYDLVTKTASAPFVKYDDIEKQLYRELQKKTGRTPEIKNSSFSVEPIHKPVIPKNGMNTTLAPDITSFSPATVTGGTIQDPANNVLTINGSGFENAPDPTTSAVEFAHADKAAGNFSDIASNSDLIISWTDTQIKLRVPTSAGTGTFRVRNSAGITANSPSSLNVLYTILTAFNGHRTVQFNLANENGTGGYSIKYSNNTANSGLDITTSTAKGTVQRALNTWKDLTGVNFVEAGSTSNQAVNPGDGENIVVFDNSASTLGNPLPNGVLATCYSGLGYCGDSTKLYFKTGFDIIIRNSNYSSGNINFTFGPCSPFSSPTQQVDLETVLLHEMGHALDLGHIIAPPQGSGTGKVNPAKLMNFSVNYNFRRISPDYSSMTGAAYTIHPHGNTYGTCLPSSPEMVPLPVTIDSKDGCPSTFPTTATPLLTSVNFDLAHCTSNELEDPAYNQFLIDGTSTSITNTAFYAFRTNTDGGDLSLAINNYATSPADLAACVPASSVAVTGVQMAIYQVNSCPGGQSFPVPIVNVNFAGNGQIPVISGLTGSTNYLMVMDGIENTKASFNMVFSGTALPKPASGFLINAYPNPVNVQNVSVQILNQQPGSYSLIMYNSLGQAVLQKTITVTSASDLETFPVSSLASGIYHLCIIGPENKRIKAITLAITK